MVGPWGWLVMGSRTPTPGCITAVYWSCVPDGCWVLADLIRTSLDPHHADRQLTTNPAAEGVV